MAPTRPSNSLGDAVLREFDARIEEAKEALAKAPADEGLKASFKKLQSEKLSAAIEDFAKRVKAYPTDLEMHYRYGDYLFRAGKTKEAIPELQQGVNDPKRKRPSLIRLGMAFSREGMAELAETQLLKALEGKHIIDDEGKEIYYQLGLVYEKLSRPEKARESYQKILRSISPTKMWPIA